MLSFNGTMESIGHWLDQLASINRNPWIDQHCWHPNIRAMWSNRMTLLLSGSNTATSTHWAWGVSYTTASLPPRNPKKICQCCQTSATSTQKNLLYHMTPFLSFIASISTLIILNPKNSFNPMYRIGLMGRPGFAALLGWESCWHASNMSPQQPNVGTLANMPLLWRHKTDPNTPFLCRWLPTFTQFVFKYQSYILRIPLLDLVEIFISYICSANFLAPLNA